MSYVIQNIIHGGTVYDITQLAGAVKWGGDIRTAARRLEVSLAFGLDYYLPKYDVPLGSLLLLKSESGEVLRGVVFDRRKSTGGGYSVIGFDHGIYLVNNRETYRFQQITPEAIIKKVCGDFNIPVGEIASTGVVLPKLIVREDSATLYDICLMALTEATKRNGKKYALRMREGKLQVIEKAKQTVRWLITEGQNLIEAEYSENINDMKNRVIILGDKDQVLAKIEDADLIKQYGILQELRREGNIKTGEAQVMAQNLLKDLGRISREASLTCLGLDDVEAGTAIELKESLTGLVGTFYVDTDEHTVTNGQHTMSLKLNWTDEVATKEAPADERE